MHNLMADAPDTWVLQEKISYTFQQTTCYQRKHHKRQAVRLQEEIPPSVIILSLWPQATTEQIDHYESGYSYLYPSAKVVLIHNNFKIDDAANDSALDELVHTQLSSHRHQPVLLHLFGTSGAAGACKLLRRYSLQTGEPLNVGAVIADAEPSPSFTTFLTSSQPISAALFSFILAFWISLQELFWFWPQTSSSVQIHHDLNNPNLLPTTARKCFVFAHRGLMLTWMKRLPRTRPGSCKDEFVGLEMNDEQDERREFAVKRSSIDQKGRWSGDQERYWSGIEGVWEGR